MGRRSTSLLVAASATLVASCNFDASTAGSHVADGSLLGDGRLSVDSAVADANEISVDGPPDVSPDAEPTFVEPPPEKGVIFALAQDNVVIDGSLDEWQKFSFVSIAAPADYVELTGSGVDAADISATAAARWSTTHLYLSVTVTDNQYQNDTSGDLIWQGDSLQVAFDVDGNGGTPYDSTDDFEYGWARAAGDQEASYRWIQPNGHPDYVAAPYNIVRNGTTTVYEVSLTAGDLGLTSFSAASEDIRFSWIVNDADGNGREGLVEWTPGIQTPKNPGLFDILRFHPSGP